VAGSAARIAGGIGIVACAAVIAFAAGGGNVFGGLGSLFGGQGHSLQVAKAAAPASDIVAEPAGTVAPRHAAGVVVRRQVGGAPRKPPRLRARGREPQRPPQSSTPAPHPAQPVPPLPPVPAPSPGGGQVVHTVAETVKQVASQLPPQVQPLTQTIDQAVDKVEQACHGLPACP
jgi:hypothetical protein